MMLGSKDPNYDAYGLFRAAHFHNPAQYFAYRGIYIPLLCSYRGGSQGPSPTYEQAHVGLDLLTLASINYRKTIYQIRKELSRWKLKKKRRAVPGEKGVGAHSRRKGHRRDVKRERTAAVRTEEKNGKKKSRKERRLMSSPVRY